MRELFDARKAFIDCINANPVRVISRLWHKTDLDPEFEKPLLSK